MPSSSWVPGNQAWPLAAAGWQLPPWHHPMLTAVREGHRHLGQGLGCPSLALGQMLWQAAWVSLQLSLHHGCAQGTSSCPQVYQRPLHQRQSLLQAAAQPGSAVPRASTLQAEPLHCKPSFAFLQPLRGEAALCFPPGVCCPSKSCCAAALQHSPGSCPQAGSACSRPQPRAPRSHTWSHQTGQAVARALQRQPPAAADV